MANVKEQQRYDNQSRNQFLWLKMRDAGPVVGPYAELQSNYWLRLFDWLQVNQRLVDKTYNQKMFQVEFHPSWDAAVV